MGVLFYLRSDGQYILSRKERPLSIRTSHSIIVHKTTAMIVSLTKYIVLLILSRKECPLSYQNVTEYNGKNGKYILDSDAIMAVFFYHYTLWRSDKTVDILFYLRSEGQYILLVTLSWLWFWPPAHGQVYSIQLSMINCVSNLRQVVDFLRVLWFPQTIKLTDTI
jgi:hypothetical protein